MIMMSVARHMDALSGASKFSASAKDTHVSTRMGIIWPPLINRRPSAAFVPGCAFSQSWRQTTVNCSVSSSSSATAIGRVFIKTRPRIPRPTHRSHPWVTCVIFSPAIRLEAWSQIPTHTPPATRIPAGRAVAVHLLECLLSRLHPRHEHGVVQPVAGVHPR